VNQSTNTGKHGWDGHGIGHIIGHVIGHVIRAFAPRAAGEWPIYATVRLELIKPAGPAVVGVVDEELGRSGVGS